MAHDYLLKQPQRHKGLDATQSENQGRYFRPKPTRKFSEERSREALGLYGLTA